MFRQCIPFWNNSSYAKAEDDIGEGKREMISNLMDRFDLDIFPTLWIKGPVLHRVRSHLKFRVDH